MGRIRISVTVGVIDGVYVYGVKKSIDKKVLVVVLAVVFNSSIGIGIGNIFSQVLLTTLHVCVTVDLVGGGGSPPPGS